MKEEDDAITELEKLLMIDEENLLKEWKEQSILLMQSYRLWARTQRQSTEEEIDLKEAESKLYVKTKLTGIEGMAKPTDEATKNVVQSDVTLLALRRHKAATDHRLNILKGLVKSFEQRAWALKYVQANRCPDIPVSNDGIVNTFGID